MSTIYCNVEECKWNESGECNSAYIEISYGGECRFQEIVEKEELHELGI